MTYSRSRLLTNLVSTDSNDLFPFPTVNQPTQHWLQWPIHIPDSQPTYSALIAVTYSRFRLLTKLVNTDCNDIIIFNPVIQASEHWLQWRFPFQTVNQPSQYWLQWPTPNPDC